MASNLNEVLLNATWGLIPYLEANVDGDYRRLQVRPWSFDNTSDQLSGFRVRDADSPGDVDIGDDSLCTEYSVLIGRIFPITSNVNGSIAAADLQVDMDKAIKRWSKCKARGLRERITDIRGTVFSQQDRSSNVWHQIVVRSFKMTVIS